ncbi:MAG TPA: hypothetical protein VMB73_24665 [Acetobacteraceae bacterium]|nr:hypothetical protein [Acetobacteraceae bacterium]
MRLTKPVVNTASAYCQRLFDRLMPWAFPIVFGIMAAVLVAPFCQTKVPPVVDYPNHLAGDYILAHLNHSAWLGRIYQPHWAVIPDLANDLILLPLLAFLPTFIAGKLVLFMALLAPLAGALFYNYALFRSFTFWPLASALVAFNFAFLLGLSSFLFGLGAAFSVVAVWIMLRERYPGGGIVVLAFGSVVVFFCHITAMSFLVALFGSYEICQFRQFTIAQASKRILPLLSIALPAGLLYLISPTASGPWQPIWTSPIEKLLFFFGPVMNYSLALDCMTGVALLAATTFAVQAGWLQIPRCTLICLIGLLVLFFVAPFRIKGGSFFDLRFIIMAGYLMFGGMRENPTIPVRHLWAALTCLTIVAGGRIFIVSVIWHAQPHQIALVQQVTRLVPPGSRVLVANEFPDTANPYWKQIPTVSLIASIFPDDYHLPTIFLAQRQAFFQTLFADPTQQPIAFRPEYQRNSVRSAAWGPPSSAMLAKSPLTAVERERYPYLLDWQTNFDYVLVMNAGAMRHPDQFIPGRLSLLGANNLAALYRVRLTTGAAPHTDDLNQPGTP